MEENNSKSVIYIVEDDESIRELLRIALISFSYEVVSFDNAESALEAMELSLPSLVIFDIMLPEMNGISATKKLREKKKTRDIPVILLTAKDTESDKVIGLDAGADDYITKPFGVMELSARIRSLLRRSSKPAIADKNSVVSGDIEINLDTREVYISGIKIELTFKEFEILHMLIKEKNRVITREEMLNSIWGFDFLGETRTLDVHIRTLRNKLKDDADNPKYIKTVRGVGYRFYGRE